VLTRFRNTEFATILADLKAETLNVLIIDEESAMSVATILSA